MNAQPVDHGNRDKPRLVHRNRKGEARGNVPTENLGSPSLRASNEFGDLSGCATGERNFVHTESMNTEFTKSIAHEHGNCVHTPHTGSMTQWPQRAQFKESAKAYKNERGVNSVGLAEDLGTTVGTLNAYLYRKDTRPSLEFLQNAARLFGSSVTLFIDDPGGLPEGFRLSDDATPGQRYLVERSLQCLTDHDLTDEDRRQIVDDMIRAADRLKAINRKIAEIHKK